MHKIIREIADDDRAYDPWGAGMMALGAVCDALHVAGGEVPVEAGYRPGAGGPDVMGDETLETVLAGLYPDRYEGYWVEGYVPGLSLADVEYAARILSRYLDWVRLAGRDY